MSDAVVKGPYLGIGKGRELSKCLLPYILGVSALATVLAISRAFNMNDVDLFIRLLFWHLVIALAVFQSIGIDNGLRRLLPKRYFFQVLASGIAIGFNIVLVTLEVHGLKYTPLCPKALDPLFELGVFIAPLVIVVSVASLLMPWFISSRSSSPERDSLLKDDTESKSVTSSTLDRELGDDWPTEPVLRLIAHDHYLEAFTREKRHFVRARMKDAVSRLNDADGMQVHRSYWVARGEVVEMQREGRDYCLKLKDGSTIPVGRSRIKILRAAGWL